MVKKVENLRAKVGRPKWSKKWINAWKKGRPRKYVKPVKTPNANEKSVTINACMETYIYWEVDSSWNVVKRQMGDILADYGMSKQLFHYYLNRNEALATKRMQLKEAKLWILKDTAQDNIWDALNGVWRFEDLESKDIAKLSLDVLKNTEKLYQPKIQQDINIRKVDLSISMEDLMKKIEESKNM